MNTKPLVSVVVVVYNSSKTIIDTLDSIVQQSYKNIELVVSDDASKDDTVSLVREWMGKHKADFKDVTIVTTLKNSGISQNCDRGVRASHGEWIKIIAGDDMLFPCAIERFVEEATKGQGDFFFAQVEMFVDDPKNMVSRYYNVFYSEAYDIFRRGYSAEEQYEIIRYSNNFCPAPAAFFSRIGFDVIGGFDLSIAMAEDMPMWLNATQKGFRLNFIDEPLVRYRIGSGSVQIGGRFAVTKRLLKYKYLLQIDDFGVCKDIKQINGYDSLSNRCRFILLKLLSIKEIRLFRAKAKEVSLKYGVKARQITLA
ncbi:MAG: glycosyltransferase [Rikenellaceae bacterium]